MPPASVNLTGATRYEQVFKIGGFTATKEIPGYTASTVCAVGGLDWQIEFHPKALDYSFSVWIMFRVRLISKVSVGVPASFSCLLVDPSPPYGGGDSPEEKITSSVFFKNHSRDVFLIKRSALEDSAGRRRPKDDCIFVQCALNVLEPSWDASAAAACDVMAGVPTSDLHEQFGELLRSQKGADITFLVSGEPVAAHRSMLAARSPVFMAELLGDMREKASPCVEIGDMEVEVFRAMLRFIYTDTVPELDQMKEEQGTTAMAQHLLVAADRYGLKRLKMICVDKLSAAIDVDNVATTLALAEQHGCSGLKDRCMKFTLANLTEVSATQGYKHLEASCPWVLTELVKGMVQGQK